MTKSLGVLVLLLLLFSCGTAVDVGQLSGVIGFEPAPQPVLDYLNGNAAQPGGTVSAKNTANTAQVATTTLTVAGGTAPPNLAQYALNPSADAGGSRFAMEVNDLRFQNGARYRFGTFETTSPGALISPNVLPGGQTTFDIKECASLAKVRVRVTGAAADLDALDEVVTCSAVATVKENPAATEFRPQAVSAPIITSKTALRNEGVSIPILVRAGQPVQLSGGCIFTTSQPGFPRNAQGVIAFGGTTPPSDVACQTEPQVQVDVPVQRSAGSLQGLLDVVGHTESRIRVDLDPTGLVFDRSNLQGETPPHVWRFDDVVSGQHIVSARALLDAGSAVLRFPQLQGAERAVIAAGQVRDLGSRFIAVPFTLNGTLSLRDPRAGTRLVHLVVDPFSSTVNNPLTSFLKAVGDPNFFESPEGERGANGRGAQSLAKLSGAFDATTQRWNLTGTLILAGLSPENGSSTGADTLPAPWKVDTFRVQLSEPSFKQTIDVGLNSSNLFGSIPNGTATLPPVDTCFGEFRVSLRAPSGFSLFAPKLEILEAIQEQLEDETGAFLRYDTASGNATAAPFEVAGAAAEANVGILLPAFLRYRLQPQVSVRDDASSQVTNLTLAEQGALPSAMIPCGALDDQCLQLDQQGIASVLRVEVISPGQSCDPNDVRTTVFAQSTAGTLQSVTLTVDNQPPIAVCGGATPCQNPLQVEVPLGAVTAGSHSVSAHATDSLGCTAISTRNVVVSERPQLVCPPPLVVQVRPGETVVPFERVSDLLRANWSGSCEASTLPPIQDNHPATFPLGSTTVRFFSGPNNTAAGEQQCETTVMVLRADGCNEFASAPAGALAVPTIIGDVEYRRLQGQLTGVDQFPPNAPDGQRELLLNGAVEVRLPFAARTVRLQYVKAHSMPIKVEGFDEAGQLVHTWESPANEQERQRFTRVITGPARTTLRITVQEHLLVSLCYSLALPRGPRPGDVILVPQN